MNRLSFSFIFGILSLSLIFLNFTVEETIVKSIDHPPTQYFNTELPSGFNDLFAGSGECAFCHQDITSPSGEDLSISDSWRSTMMANSAKDPFWRAKVSHEILAVPQNQEIVEKTCTKCHAPAGNIEAHYNGQTSYSIEEMINDPLAMDGVTCTVCHQITPESMGNFSGNFLVGENHTIWGPYSDNILTMPMIQHTGYTPAYSNHIQDSRLCGSCHTLITQTVDLEGNFTGGTFVEQAIFHEWQNSDYATNGTSCQSCHLPRTEEEVVISSRPPWFDTTRSPFGKHDLVGANVFMLKVLRDNATDLGITATTAQFDNTISKTLEMLQQKTLDMTLVEKERTSDTLFLELNLANKAGHKFPGGYPSRRAFIELMVINSSNDTIFHSGKMDQDFQIIHEDETFEPHYSMINQEDQVQIYEMIMGNVNGEVTTVLEMADHHLKDNRLPPAGFTTDHFCYDTVQIVGNALIDENFNKISGEHGSGADMINFHIPLNEETGDLAVFARVYYQTVSSKWLSEMFSHSSSEIDAFKSYYENADKTPTTVQEQSLVSSVTSIFDNGINDKITVYPNPAKGQFFVESPDKQITDIEIYSLAGNRIYDKKLSLDDPHKATIETFNQSGVVLLKVYFKNEEIALVKAAIIE